MKKLKATWTIDVKALEDRIRGYEMVLVDGANLGRLWYDGVIRRRTNERHEL